METAFKFMNVIGPFAKNLENPLFSKTLWLDLLPSPPVWVVALEENTINLKYYL